MACIHSTANMRTNCTFIKSFCCRTATPVTWDICSLKASRGVSGGGAGICTAKGGQIKREKGEPMTPYHSKSRVTSTRLICLRLKLDHHTFLFVTHPCSPCLEPPKNRNSARTRFLCTNSFSGGEAAAETECCKAPALPMPCLAYARQ